MKSPIKKLTYARVGCHSLGVGVLLVGSVLAFLFAFQPKLEAKTELLEQQVRSEELLDQGVQIENRFFRLQAEVNELTQELDDSADRVPEMASEAEFLGQVAQLAKMSDLDIETYQVGEDIQKDKHREVTLQLSTIGTYASICLFLEHLHKLPRLCRAAEVKVGTDQAGERYPCEMTLTIYYGLKD